MYNSLEDEINKYVAFINLCQIFKNLKFVEHVFYESFRAGFFEMVFVRTKCVKLFLFFFNIKHLEYYHINALILRKNHASSRTITLTGILYRPNVGDLYKS